MLAAGGVIDLAAGAYRLREPVGGSAYGVVWRAQAPGASPDVAVKLVNRAQMQLAPAAQQQRWIDSAHSELAFLRSLAPWDERHIVRLLDHGCHDGLPVMALELLGVDLARHMAALRLAGRAPSLMQALGWIGQLNQALAKVHQYGWIYLDLKPANVLVTAAGDVKLADFGTCRPQQAAAATAYAGTASWQAPEQFFPSASLNYDADARADFFALGAMLFFLVTGGQPLRYCAACGDAFREHPDAAAAILLARHGGAVPATLSDDEAAAFEGIVASQAGNQAASAALALLRCLLAPQRAARARHAMQVSRLMAAVTAAVTARDRPAPARARSFA